MPTENSGREVLMGLFSSFGHHLSTKIKSLSSRGVSAAPKITFADLSEQPEASDLPDLDKPLADAGDLTEAQRRWHQDGIAVFPGMLPDDLLEAYVTRRAKLNDVAGWKTPTPYEHVPELRDLALYPPLMAQMKSLIGEDMMLHLALTGWVTTERDWHQDAYLNPDFVNGWYCAVWMALDDISKASGPFQYVPGSHQWPLLRINKVRSFLTDDELNKPDPRTGRSRWEQHAERFMTPAIKAEIKSRHGKVVDYLPKRGDVLIWHSRLMHRGSPAKRFHTERRALITHYSGVNHRPDMVVKSQTDAGQWYATFNLPLE